MKNHMGWDAENVVGKEMHSVTEASRIVAAMGFRAEGAAFSPSRRGSLGSCAQEHLKLQAPQPPLEILIWGSGLCTVNDAQVTQLLMVHLGSCCRQTPPLGLPHL